MSNAGWNSEVGAQKKVLRIVQRENVERGKGVEVVRELFASLA